MRTTYEVPRRSRTFRVPCRYCGAQVYFHSNEYGSKVLFDDLGQPWPKHECREYQEWITGVGPESANNRNTVSADWDYLKGTFGETLLKRKRQRRDWISPIVAIKPELGATVMDTGVLRDVIPSVNVMKKLGAIRETRFAAKLLGVLATQDWGQITIHAADIMEDSIAGYTMLVGRHTLAELDLIPGSVVAFTAQAENPVIGQPLWICRRILEI